MENDSGRDSASVTGGSPEVGDATRSGMKWILAGRASSQAVQLATSIVLARLLVPDDFGLIAMAIAVGGFAKAFGDFGVSALVIQRRDLAPTFTRAAFTLNIAVFLALALLQLVLSPVGGLVMRDDRVVAVIAALSLVLPLQGVASFYQALLRRDLAFGETVKLNVLSILISSAVACSLAAAGAGVWSLVAAQIAAPAAVSLWAYRLFPDSVRLDIAAARGNLSEILEFGRFATGNSIVNYLVQNMDYLLIGRLLSSSQLGFYYFAFEKSRVLSRRVLDLYSHMSLPVFSRMNDDTERIRRGYQVATIGALVLIAPAVTFLAVHAELLIPLVFGAKWNPSVLVFQILSVHVIVNALTSGIGSVLYAVGRPDISFRIVRWIVVPLGIGYLVGAKTSGIVGVAIAAVAIKSAFSLIKLGVCFRFLRWDALKTLGPAIKVIGIALASGFLSASVSLMPVPGGDWGELIMTAFAYFIAFAGLQVVANRSALALVWKSLLGPRGLEWCNRKLPSPLQSILGIPDMAVGQN